MTLEEARELFVRYDGSMYRLWAESGLFNEFEDMYIPAETLEQWRKEFVVDSINNEVPLSRLFTIIREAKDFQPLYTEHFIDLLGNYTPEENELLVLLKEPLEGNETCGYNWLKQFVEDTEELDKAVKSLLSQAEGTEIEALRESFNILYK